MPEGKSEFAVDVAAAFGGFVASRLVSHLITQRFGATGLLAEVGSSLVVFLGTRRFGEIDDYREMISIGSVIALLEVALKQCAPPRLARLIEPGKLGDYSDAHERLPARSPRVRP